MFVIYFLAAALGLAALGAAAFFGLGALGLVADGAFPLFLAFTGDLATLAG